MSTKKVIFLAFAVFIFILGCKKDDDSPNPNTDSNQEEKDLCLTTNLSISASVNEDTVVITATGGRRPYTYAYDTINGNTFTSDSIFPKLPFATYTFYVKDANGCVKSVKATVKDNTPGNLKLPLYMSQYFLLTGIWADGDNSVTINFSSDTTWDNATANFVYTVGNNKWGGGSYLYNDSWDDSLRISPDITKVSFSVKADPGLEVTLNLFPDLALGTHTAVADGNWHKVELSLENKTYPTWIKGGNIMNTVWKAPASATVGTEYNFAIKNIVFE
ncbi:MAG TPA: hypothetical protein VIK89_05845 [Cytophagaceae bacterium]